MAGDIGKSLKGFWMKGMEAIGNTASTIANNTKYKVSEMNIVNRRREILSDFGAISYELWQKGEKFPEPLDNLLKELDSLDRMLNELRAEHITGVDTAEEKKEASPEAETTEETEAPAILPEAEEYETIGNESTENPAAEDIAEEVPVIEVIGDALEEAAEKIDTEAAAESFRQAMDDLGSAAEARYADIEKKVDVTIDSVTDTLQQVSGKLSQGIKDLVDKLASDNSEPRE